MPTNSLAGANYIVAQTARAAVGLIGAGIKAVGCEAHADGVTLHFAIISRVETEREDIEEIAFELDVLLEGHTPIATHVHEGVSTLDWSRILPVYSAKQQG